MTQQWKISKTATKVYTDEFGWTRVIYHNACVVKFNQDKIILSMGGWNTNTTRTRMNQASNQYGLGFGVHQKKGTPYVCIGSVDTELKTSKPNIIDRKTGKVSTQ